MLTQNNRLGVGFARGEKSESRSDCLAAPRSTISINNPGCVASAVAPVAHPVGVYSCAVRSLPVDPSQVKPTVALRTLSGKYLPILRPDKLAVRSLASARLRASHAVKALSDQEFTKVISFKERATGIPVIVKPIVVKPTSKR